MIISGNKIARAIRDELSEIVGVGSAGMFTLHIFIVGDDPVIENFVMKKRDFAEVLGVRFVEHRFDNAVDQGALISEIRSVVDTHTNTAQNDNKLGIVVQLPLPSTMGAQTVLDAVPAEYDIDGLATESSFLPPVAGAVREIIERKRIQVSGRKALVVGKGRLVGVPVAKLLRELGAEVTMADKKTTHSELTALCKHSDIIVSGAGVPNLITPEMVRDGVTLLDAGTSTQAGSVVGDIAYQCKDKARYFSRTPGGIGPVTVAVLFKNLILGNNLGR